MVMVLGASYAAVPLYRIYCQTTKSSGHAVIDNDINEKVANMKKVADRKIKVTFEADTSSRLAWDFKPSQHTISCSLGETVLAFYTATNQLDRPVNGIATYTILPYDAGQYFNKIQCFCFEEQQLNPNELVDLPVFFFIDPEFDKDPAMFDVNEIILSYNFFETKTGVKLARPDSYKPHGSERNVGSATVSQVTATVV